MCLIPQTPLLFLILKNIYSKLPLDIKPVAFLQPMTTEHLSSDLSSMSIHYQGRPAFPASQAESMFLGQTIISLLASSILNGPSFLVDQPQKIGGYLQRRDLALHVSHSSKDQSLVFLQRTAKTSLLLNLLGCLKNCIS